MEYRPIVLINGILNQLPIGDTIAGSSGTPQEEELYSKRIDFISDSILYKGEAVVGALESDAVWRIRKIIIGNDGDITEIWADGDSNFNNIWNNRLSYTYS
jgi:hypothetical protein